MLGDGAAGRAAPFWRDTMVIARAVAEVVQPIKMNYEIHWNTLPHLHVHRFPRHPHDRSRHGLEE